MEVGRRVESRDFGFGILVLHGDRRGGAAQAPDELMADTGIDRVDYPNLPKSIEI